MDSSRIRNFTFKHFSNLRQLWGSKLDPQVKRRGGEFFATFFVQDERRQREEEVLHGGSTVGLETVFAGGVSHLKERRRWPGPTPASRGRITLGIPIKVGDVSSQDDGIPDSMGPGWCWCKRRGFFCLGCKAAKIPSKIHPFDVGPVFGMGFPYEQKVIDFDWNKWDFCPLMVDNFCSTLKHWRILKTNVPP